ncbi:hypothetical protein GCM10011335_14200 [Aureimonas glaciei]|uniref:Gene transfer agent family protein n=1 Tax=Aureimonas glaciei TaxID=1776957 RepID=A0A916XUP1_9HYPH|nr:hypothetical protein GCM10011335_14200 [Aureimonas glaciei]
MRRAVNRRRGEVAGLIDGEDRVLCLTLGALAELEDAFAAEDVAALLARFSAGRLAARDLIRILGAGLRGGGMDVDDAAVAQMRIDGGTAGAARLVAALLAAAFGEAEEAPAKAEGAAAASVGDASVGDAAEAAAKTAKRAITVSTGVEPFPANP